MYVGRAAKNSLELSERSNGTMFRLAEGFAIEKTDAIDRKFLRGINGQTIIKIIEGHP